MISAALLEELELEEELQRRAFHSMKQIYQHDPVGFIERFFDCVLTNDVKKLCESFRDNPVTVGISATGTGKSHVAARLALWLFMCFSESQIYTLAAAPKTNLDRILWAEIGEVSEDFPDWFNGFDMKALFISRSAKSFVAGIAIPSEGTREQRISKVSGWHAPVLGVILDESDSIPDEVFIGIDGCMSSEGTHMLCLFNPKSQSGAVYKMIRDGIANVVTLGAFNHPNVLTGKNVIPGAVSRDKTVERTLKWTRELVEDEPVTDECFEVPDFLVGLSSGKLGPVKPGFRKIVIQEYYYKVLGKYPAQGESQLISREWTAAARRRWDEYVMKHGELPQEYRTGVAGYDVSEGFSNDDNCLVLKYGNWVPSLDVWSGIDTLKSCRRIKARIKDKKITKINVDATGVGSTSPVYLKEIGLPGVAVKVASSPNKKSELGEFRIIRDQLFWDVREWLRCDDAMLPPDEKLLEELHVLTYCTDSGKVEILSKKDIKVLIGRSPDRADGLSFTFYKGGGYVNDENDLS